MIDRFIAILYLELINHIITTDPARSTVSHKEGNEFVNFKTRVGNLVLFFFLFVYHLTYYGADPLSIFDYLLLTTVTTGAVFRLWSFIELGRFFTFSIGIQEDHKLISTGPYRIFTHPGYVGQFMVIVGMIWFCYLPLIILLPLKIYVFYRFYHRIAAEEKMLLDHFGEAYLNYKQSVLLF